MKAVSDAGALDTRCPSLPQRVYRYTRNNGIRWDGKSSSGENLARDIYFCVIEVTDGFTPEAAILKLALTR